MIEEGSEMELAMMRERVHAAVGTHEEITTRLTTPRPGAAEELTRAKRLLLLRLRIGWVEDRLAKLPKRAKRKRARPKTRPSIGARLRFRVLERDGRRCRYCGADAAQTKLHVDHVIPVASGGLSTMDNLVTACERCNLGKSNKVAVEISV